jgi:hypothetical protein
MKRHSGGDPACRFIVVPIFNPIHTIELVLWYNILRYVLPSVMERKPLWATEDEVKC